MEVEASETLEDQRRSGDWKGSVMAVGADAQCKDSPGEDDLVNKLRGLLQEMGFQKAAQFPRETGRPSLECFKCGGKGHIARYCSEAGAAVG